MCDNGRSKAGQGIISERWQVHAGVWLIRNAMKAMGRRTTLRSGVVPMTRNFWPFKSETHFAF